MAILTTMLASGLSLPVNALPRSLIARNIIYEPLLPKPPPFTHTGVMHLVIVAQTNHLFRDCVKEAVRLYVHDHSSQLTVDFGNESLASTIHVWHEAVLGTVQRRFDDNDIDIVHTFGNNEANASCHLRKECFVDNVGLSRLRVEQMEMGLNYVAMLTVNGRVYTTGLGVYGVLGLGKDLNHWRATSMEGLGRVEGLISSKFIKKIAAGRKHVVAIDDEGEVYTWGSHEGDRLGPADEKNTAHTKCAYSPIRVHLHALNGKRVRYAAAGGAHTLLLTTCGEVYSYGFAPAGALGWEVENGLAASMYCSQERQCSIGKVVLQNTNYRAICVAAGGRHSVIVTSSGEVHACGENGSWQLMIGEEALCPLPRRVWALHNVHVVKASACGNCTVLLDKDGNVYDSTSDSTLVRQVQFQEGQLAQPIVGIASGMGYSSGFKAKAMARCAAGDVYSWGRMGMAQSRIPRDDPVLTAANREPKKHIHGICVAYSHCGIWGTSVEEQESEADPYAPGCQAPLL